MNQLPNIAFVADVVLYILFNRLGGELHGKVMHYSSITCITYVALHITSITLQTYNGLQYITITFSITKCLLFNVVGI